MERQKRSVVISFNIEPELKARLQKLASREERSVSFIIRRALWQLARARRRAG